MSTPDDYFDALDRPHSDTTGRAAGDQDNPWLHTGPEPTASAESSSPSGAPYPPPATSPPDQSPAEPAPHRLQLGQRPGLLSRPNRRGAVLAVTAATACVALAGTLIVTTTGRSTPASSVKPQSAVTTPAPSPTSSPPASTPTASPSPTTSPSTSPSADRPSSSPADPPGAAPRRPGGTDANPQPRQQKPSAPPRRSTRKPSPPRTQRPAPTPPKPKPKPKPRLCPVYDNGVVIAWRPC